ncbi:MAG TPA: hypothetical protein DCQ04_07415 [Actinobacteria bacterium]|jgi:hypothetical protein|nr:hypothetical protein [Actinomycetota bacterium]
MEVVAFVAATLRSIPLSASALLAHLVDPGETARPVGRRTGAPADPTWVNVVSVMQYARASASVG